MSHYNRISQQLATLLLLFAGLAAQAQPVKRLQPVWWFGESVAANFNVYRGTTQMLDNNFSAPTAFHKGKGVRPYASLLMEYRPGKMWGGMLNVAYDGRGGKFDGVMAPCNCAATLSTNTSYIAVEPSLRLAPFSSAFYVFAGPTLSFNVSKSYLYTQEKQADTRGSWSNMHKAVFSAQAGAGVDIQLSAPAASTQVSLSPFASFLTDFGHEPRSVESWSFYTIRAGIALKFGSAGKSAPKTTPADAAGAAVPMEKEVQFSVRAPKAVPQGRKVKETFALRNSVFFDMGSAEIPNRYVLLTNARAATFMEVQLQYGQPDNLSRGRSARQMTVYHNILNILGDRMRSNPSSAIVLSGASDKNPQEGKQMAENVKHYLVAVFGIDAARISTEGRDKPVVASEQPGATRELALLREGDRRVDIETTSPALLKQVGGKNETLFAPVQIEALQEDPMDSQVLFDVAGAGELLESWSVDITDEKGNIQHYGPYTGEQAAVSGKTILAGAPQGNYKVMMVAQTKTGRTISKESTVSLVKRTVLPQEGLRYSILFDFDKSQTVAGYETFLTEVVAPLVPEDGTVIIHGHTDIIGDDVYNRSLSNERAAGARQIMEKALSKAGKKNVRFETYGFGKDPSMAPFENQLPEERFYNRTVIIDIIPDK